MLHRLEDLLFRSIQLFVLLLPLKSVQRLGAGVGALIFRLAGSRRQIALENLRHAFPEKNNAERERIARKAFQSYATTLMELLWVPNIDEDGLRRIVHPLPGGIDTLVRSFRQGKGVIVVSAHLANWELIGLGLSQMSGIPVSIVVQTQNNRLVDARVNRLRTKFGNKVVPMGISVREIVKALAQKEAVALAADQSGVQEGPFVEFFGRMVATHQGPAVFALRSGAPMVMVLAVRRTDGTYDGIVEEIPAGDLTGLSDENVRILTQRHARVLESYIRRYPGQWLWMHRRWKHLAPASAIASTEQGAPHG